MIGSGAGSAFSNISVLLTANNAQLRSVLSQSSASVNAFGRTVDQNNKKSDSLGKTLGKGLAAGAGLAAAGLTYATSKAIEFDKAMRNVNSLAGLSEEKFATLEKRVIAMSTTLPQSATILAEGLYDIQSSGFSGADAMKVLEASALSASAGLTTTEVSAKAISAVLNAYGLKAKDAADVSDVLFQTVNAGVISFDELATGLGNVVGGTAAAKVSIDQVGSAIATMTLAGIGGAEATTSLNALMQKLVQPSDALAAMYEKLGYESGASALETDGLRGVMEKLRTATGGNITTLLELFPEIRAARGALALMANEGKNYTKVAGQIEDKNGRAGAAQKVFNEQMKSASAQLELMKNKADAVAISLGLKILPVLSKVMVGLQDLAGTVTEAGSALLDELSPGLQDAATTVANLLSLMKDLGMEVWREIEPFVKLAGVVGGGIFNELMSALETTTSWLRENQGAALVLATAIGITLAGGVAVAASELTALVFLMLVNAIGAMGKLATQAKITGAALLRMAPGILITASIMAVVSAWQQYTNATKEVREANAGVQDGFDRFDLSSAAKEVARLKELADETSSAVNETVNHTGLLDAIDDFARIDKNARTSGLIDSDTADKYEEAKNALDNYRFSAVYLMGALDKTGASQKELLELTADYNGLNGPDKQTAALERLDAVIGRFGPKLEELGVDLSDGLQTDEIQIVTEYMDSLGGTTAETAQKQQNLVDKLGAVDTAMGDTEAAADDLKKALDDLMGASMGVDEANITWRQGLRELNKELRKGGTALLGHTKDADKNRLAVQGQLTDLQDLLVAQAKSGKGAARITDTLRTHRQALLDAADAAGINAGEMKALLRQYNLTPDVVATLIKEYGGKNVKKMLSDVERQADHLGKKKPTQIGFGVTAPTKKGDDFFASLNADIDKVGKKKPQITVGAEVDKAGKMLDDLADKSDKLDKKKPTIDTSAPGATQAESQIDAAGRAADRVNGKTVTITTVHKSVGKNANGGFYPDSFAEGGFRQKVLTSASTGLPKQAQIQPGVGKGLVQWAEGETGGEAFIPLGQSKRPRSLQILEQVAATFGMQLAEMESFADGGFPKFEFHYKPFRFRSRHAGKKGKDGKVSGGEKESAYNRERAQARKEYERDRHDAYLQQQQEWREQKRLWEITQGQGEGAFQAAPGDAAGTMANLSSSAEARAQAAAELKARQSKNPYDTAEDFYKKPILSIEDYVKALGAAQKATAVWGNETASVARGAGADVVASLQAMGEDGAKYIKMLATSSVEDMEKMAAKLRKIQFMEFQNGLEQDIAAQSQFAANLAALINMGRGDLAAQFADMGYQNAGGLAASAVTMSGAALDTLTGQMAQQDALSDPAMNDAIALAGALAGSSRKLGIVGLSTASGKSVSDVVGLLQRYDKDVFSKMPAKQMAQIRADQALLAAGQQPSGLEYGGIVQGSRTSDSMYYRWAEKGSGGESLIPLGQDRRQRALSIWETTGRMLGAHSVRGGGSSMIVVQSGAVIVQVDASGQQLSEAQVRGIARSASDDAMASLASKLQSGKR